MVGLPAQVGESHSIATVRMTIPNLPTHTSKKQSESSMARDDTDFLMDELNPDDDDAIECFHNFERDADYDTGSDIEQPINVRPTQEQRIPSLQVSSLICFRSMGLRVFLFRKRR